MSPDWVQVRLRRETHAALRAFGERMLKLTYLGRNPGINVDTEVPGIDVLVQILLQRDEQAQERNRRRKRGKGQGGSALSLPPGQQEREEGQ